MAKEKFYITTSIPYLNAAPHLGFALEAVQADAIARYQRLLGRDVFFLSGADEHGAKIVRAAEAAKKTPQAFVDEQVTKFQDLLKNLNISNDDFIRTSDKVRHWPGAQLLWTKLKDSGDIYKSFYKGLYCVGHEAFITEKDLKDGVCELHKKPPEAVEEENYFFKLSKYAGRIKEALEKGELKILPEWRKAETLNMLAEIGDISFSRPAKDISWGVPVPGDATQTMYVWCDALANYITGSKYWPADVHVIGKDIVKFHTIFWPAMLMSAGLPLPKAILVHGFINLSGEKISKSLGNVIDPFSLLKKYGSDAVRFYLLHDIPTFVDTEYSDEHFKAVYNGSLVNGLGNFLSRVLKMAGSLGELKKPDDLSLNRFPIRKNLEFLTGGRKPFSLEEAAPMFLVDKVIWPRYHNTMDQYRLSEALETVWAYLRRLDEYIEDYKPYKLMKSDPESAKAILWHLAYSLASSAWMLKPFMPDTSDKILDSLGVASQKDGWTKFSVKDIAHLFPRIE